MSKSIEYYNPKVYANLYDYIVFHYFRNNHKVLGKTCALRKIFYYKAS